jgi:hypothetical protein
VIRVEVIGLDDVRRQLSAISQALESRVIPPALNKVADKAKSEATRAIVGEYAVKASEVRNSVSIYGASSGRMEAVITVFGSPSKRGRSMNLIHFLAVAQQAGKAVRVKGKKVTKADIAQVSKQLGFLIRRAGGIKTIPGAFVGNKGRTVFIREGRARLPIKPLQVIGFSQMFSSRKILNRVLARIREEMPVEVSRAIKRFAA